MDKIKELLDAQTKAIHDNTLEISKRFLGQMPEQQIILTTFAAVTAVQKAMHDTLIKMETDPNIIAEIEGM